MIAAGAHLAMVPVVPGQDAGWACLSTAERTRATRIGSADVRTRFVTGRATLRGLLALELGCPPEDVPLGTSADGRPALLTPTPLRCSISHTADLVVVAVVADFEVGVDVERLDRAPLPPAASWLSPAERCRLDGVPEPDRQAVLVRTWTAKEAVVKALGRGLGVPLRDVEVDGTHARLAATTSTWRLARLPTGPEHVATLASTPVTSST